ncbi:hypothetical protein Dxin01_00155 [Deinococcus xinjiangensis]|uniref:Uncharacterized protein n=1 Tax=Deinococcus xinjiangensis TaxID=457454 RepID=A0ABP9V576_9DEIO
MTQDTETMKFNFVLEGSIVVPVGSKVGPAGTTIILPDGSEVGPQLVIEQTKGDEYTDLNRDEVLALGIDYDYNREVWA